MILQGDADGEHLRAEVDHHREVVRLVQRIRTDVDEQAASRFKPLYPRFRERYLAVIPFAEWRSVGEMWN